MKPAAKLKGGALYIALIICIIIGIILSVLILIAHFNQRQVLGLLGNEQLKWNLRSAFHLAQSDYFEDTQNDRWQVLDNEDSLRIKVLQWGAYTLIEARTKNHHQSLEESGLYGTWLPADTALYMEDAGRPVSLGGTVSFKGAVYFPTGGFRTAYIEGAGAVIDPMVGQLVRHSGGTVPGLKSALVESLKELLMHPERLTDSLGSLDKPIYVQSFSEKTLLVRSGNFEFTGLRLSHNVKLVAVNEITLDSSAHLDNVLLIAAKVRFKKGFSGAVQVVASDSIILEEECHLLYPSSLAVVASDNSDKGLRGIFMGERCRVEGAVLAINASTGDQKVIVTTKTGTELCGLVYSSNYAGVQGTVYGSLICSRLLLQTPSAVYENHFFNCSIDPKKYAASIYVPAVFERSHSVKCVKKL